MVLGHATYNEFSYTDFYSAEITITMPQKKEYARNYYRENREKRLAYQHNYIQENYDRVKEYQREYEKRRRVVKPVCSLVITRNVIVRFD